MEAVVGLVRELALLLVHTTSAFIDPDLRYSSRQSSKCLGAFKLPSCSNREMVTTLEWCDSTESSRLVNESVLSRHKYAVHLQQLAFTFVYLKLTSVLKVRALSSRAHHICYTIGIQVKNFSIKAIEVVSEIGWRSDVTCTLTFFPITSRS